MVGTVLEALSAPRGAEDTRSHAQRYHDALEEAMGWTLVRHPDGTTTAWNRDRSKVLRSHSPPARAG